MAAPWRSGYAEVCKTLYTGSNPVGASKIVHLKRWAIFVIMNCKVSRRNKPWTQIATSLGHQSLINHLQNRSRAVLGRVRRQTHMLGSAKLHSKLHIQSIMALLFHLFLSSQHRSSLSSLLSHSSRNNRLRLRPSLGHRQCRLRLMLHRNLLSVPRSNMVVLWPSCLLWQPIL